MEKKRSVVSFYIMLTFVSLLLSGWIITVSNHKDRENAVLQNEIDSLVGVINTIHGQDTTLNYQQLIPKQKTVKDDNFQMTVIIHTVVIGTFIILFILYMKCIKRGNIKNGEKSGCLTFRRRKKVI